MGGEHEHFTPGRSAWSARLARPADLSAGVLRPAVPGVQPAPPGAGLRSCWCTSPTGRRRAPTPGGSCCGHGPSRTRLTWSASTGSGRTARGVAYAGDSVAHRLPRAAAELDCGEAAGVSTVDARRRGAARRSASKFPAHLDADALYPGANGGLPAMKKPTRVNHPPAVELPPDNRPVVAPIYQTVKFEFDTLEETERFLRGERPGFLLHARLQSHHAAARAAAGGAAGARGLPGHRVRRRRDRADAARADQAGRSRLCFVETYNPTRYLIRRAARRASASTHTMLSIEDCAGVERVLAAQPDAAGVLREPDQSGHQDRRHRRAYAPGARRRRAQRHGQHLCRLPPARRATRSICSCTASPSTPPAPAT